MMNSETFIYGMQTAHDALYKLYKPDSESEYQIIKRLIDGFIMLLAGFDPGYYKIINNFLMTHSKFDKDEVYLLYTYLTDDENETDKN